MYPKLWSDEVEARIRAEARNLDPQERPATVQMCTRCVITNQRPRIVFDDEGVCSACRYAERKRNGIDWTQREAELRDLLDRHRSSGAVTGYDCIVPASGGKDSSFVATTLRDTYQMTPLCTKFAPFVYTDIGLRNWVSFIQHGFDGLVFWPSGLVHRKLARLSLEYLGDHFQAFVYGQLCWPVHAAVQNGVSLVFGAENGEATYGGDTSADDAPRWSFDDWERVYMKGHDIRRLVLIGRELGAFTDAEMAKISEFYSLPHPKDLEGIEYHWLAHYLNHHPQGNYYHAVETTGFEPNEERSEGTYSRYASLDDATDGFHYYLGFLKFGIGRATSDAAHEIRDGDLTRDEGLALVRKYDGEFPSRYYDVFKAYLGLDDGQFSRVAERFRGAQVPADRAA